MNFKNYTANSNAAAKATTSKNDQVNSVAVQEHEKSIVDLSYAHKTTFNTGKLVPIYFAECYPGDHFNIDVGALLKMSIPSAPTMDSPRYDINFFFVPWKQVFPNWNDVIGESYEGGAPVEKATVPAIQFDSLGNSSLTYSVNDLADYFNVPVNVNLKNIGVSISALPFRAYVKIWNDWYRDENLDEIADYSNDNNANSNVSFNNETFTPSGINDVQYGFGLLQVNRLRDYFASCLPFIQKGDVPTIATVSNAQLQDFLNNVGASEQLPLNTISENADFGASQNITTIDANGDYLTWIGSNSPGGSILNTDSVSGDTGLGQKWFTELNNGQLELNTDFNNDTGLGTFNITDLRNALVKQHQNELDARAGTRYYEKLLSYWGVELNPLEIGRSEYIGGWHGNVSINNVVQSAPNNATANTPLGTLGGLSITSDSNKNTVNYSCTQYGIIIGCICVRTNITYSQGLPRLFTKLQDTDFYNPTFNGISEQPIYAYELYLDGSSATNNNNQVFGFNQPFADLKYTVNRASGYVGANATDTYYNFYTYQNVLSSTPTLSNTWMYYPASALENTLLLDANNTKELVNDFLADFYFNVKCAREIPAYSVPGVDKI